MRNTIFLLSMLIIGWSNAEEKIFTIKYDKVIGHCDVVASAGGLDEDLFNSISPSRVIYFDYINNNRVLDVAEMARINASGEYKLLLGPQHGNLIPSETKLNNYKYRANKDYTGMDKIIFEIKLDGNIYKGIYSVYVTKGHPATYDGCPNPPTEPYDKNT